MGYIGRYTAPSIVDLESPVSVDGTTIIENGVLKNVGIDGIKLKSSGDSITKSDGTTAVLSESGGVVTLNNGTIGSGVVFPTRSDFGVIEVFDAGTPLIDTNASQDFSYTAGEPYFVMCNVNGGGNSSYWEYYNITTSNTVSELRSWTVLITPTIPSSGTLRITVDNTADRDVWAILLVRMNH